jgi:hypothetical protein
VKRALVCAALLWGLSPGLGVAQTKLDDFLKPEPAGKAEKAAADPAEASPASAAGAAPEGASDGPRVTAAEARRARREARHARKQQVDSVTAPVQSSTVKPADKKAIEASGAEKAAARTTAVDTVANDPASSKVVTREAARPARGKRKPAEPKPRPAKKKTAYDIARESWHAAAPPELCEQFKASEVPNMVLKVQGKDLTFVLRPRSRAGGWDDEQLAIAKEAFGGWAAGPTPSPRTLDLVYAATLHFGCPYVTLISGIRKDRGGSRHSHGLAADIVLPGVDDEELAAYFRAQGFVGVGTYPRSGFVHVDTRDQSFFWIDNSKPNQRGRVVQVRKDESFAADEAARARGDGGFVNPPKLQKALKVRMARKRRVAAARRERQVAKAVQTPTTEL